MDSKELKKVKKIVSKLKLPKFVEDIEFHETEDHLDQPCVKVRVIISDEEIDSGRFPDSFMPVRYKISRAILDSDVSLYPYVRVAPVSERAELV